MEDLSVSATSNPKPSRQTWLPLLLGIGSTAFLLAAPVMTRIIAHWISLSFALTGVIAAIVILLRFWLSRTSVGAVRVVIGLTVCLLMTVLEATGIHIIQLIEQSKNNSPLPILRSFHGAQISFNSRRGRFATLKELADEGLIDRYYANGKVIQGYIYSSTDVSDTTYCIHADRAPGSKSSRDFSIAEDGVIHYIDSPVKGTVPRGAGTPIILNKEE